MSNTTTLVWEYDFDPRLVMTGGCFNCMNNEGISVGIYDAKKTTITWYQAHSLMRQRGGAITVFALNNDRTPVTVPAKRFAGACNCIAGRKIDILEWKQ